MDWRSLGSVLALSLVGLGCGRTELVFAVEATDGSGSDDSRVEPGSSSAPDSGTAGPSPGDH